MLSQLPQALQQLGQQFQNGTLSLHQALTDAARDLGDRGHQVAHDVSAALRTAGQDIRHGAAEAILATERDTDLPLARLEGQLFGVPLGATGPDGPGHSFFRASIPADDTGVLPHHLVAGTAGSAVTGSSTTPFEVAEFDSNAGTGPVMFGTREENI